MNLLQPSNNLGYNDIDYINVDEQEVVALREKYIEKVKSMQTQLISSQEGVKESSDAMSVSSYKLSEDNQVDELDYIKMAIEIYF